MKINKHLKFNWILRDFVNIFSGYSDVGDTNKMM